jgi:hypothetical protein
MRHAASITGRAGGFYGEQSRLGVTKTRLTAGFRICGGLDRSEGGSVNDSGPRYTTPAARSCSRRAPSTPIDAYTVALSSPISGARR